MNSEDKNIPRTFMTRAYLKELDKGVFGLFRHIEIENKDLTSGLMKREKFGKPIGPLKIYREVQKGEESNVTLRTFHPTENRPIDLVEIIA